MRTRFLMAMALAALVAACDGDAAAPHKTPAQAPTLGNKADLAGVRILGDLRLGDTAEATFTRDGQFLGWTVALGPGTPLLAEVTSVAQEALDTTLFLYGPAADGRPGPLVAADDDGGRGALSRLAVDDMPGGDYVVVVGSYDQRGRGGFELFVGCDGDRPCAPIAAAVPPILELEALRVSLALHGQTEILKHLAVDVRTTDFTRLSLSVDHEELRLTSNPPLEIDVVFPARNLELVAAGRDFAAAASFAEFDDGGWGVVSVLKRATEAFEGLIDKAVDQTPLAEPHYDLFLDPSPVDSLKGVMANIVALQDGQIVPEIALEDFALPIVGASMRLTEGFEHTQGKAGIVVAPGTGFGLDVVVEGGLGPIIAADALTEALGAASIRRLELRTDGVELLLGGEPLVRLEEVHVKSGGIVSLKRFQMLGTLEEAEGIEDLIRLLGITLAIRAGHLPPPEAAESSFISDLTRYQIEQALTDTVTTLVRENRDAIPGVDLITLLGVE